MKKFLIVSIVALLLILSTACSEEKVVEESSVEETGVSEISDVTYSEEISEASSAPAVIIPSIKGSHYTDITLNLKANGFPDANKSSIEGTDFRTCNSKKTDFKTSSILSYDVTYGRNSEIISASFEASNDLLISGDEFIELARSYLSFCATFPYDNNDSERAKKWVADNINNIDSSETPATLQIGDAVFEIFGDNASNGIPIFRTLYISTYNPN